MTQITTTVDDSEVRAAAHRLTLAVERLPQRTLKPIIRESMEQARTYPPELAGQVYRRTGTYYRSFKIESVGRGYRITSNARQKGRRYTKYVGGLADGSEQAEIHRGRWTLIHDAARKALDKIVDAAGEVFRRAINNQPGGL